jgi:hypothetical protein
VTRDDDVDVGRALRTIAAWGEPADIPPLSALVPTWPSYPTPVDPRSRKGWWIAAAAALVLIVSVAALAVARTTQDSSPYVGSVPDGWKPIVVGSVQFAVPDQWPVHAEWSCWDQTTNGVHLEGAPQIWTWCSGDKGELNLGASPHPMEPDGILAAVGNPQAGPQVTLEDLNGLRAVFDYRVDDSGYSYTYFLVDEDVLFTLTFGDEADTDLARRIIDTIGPAQESNPPDVEDSTATVDPFCSLVAADADVPETYVGSAEHQADLASMLAPAPAEVRPQLGTLQSYLESGAVDPARPDSQLIDNWPPEVQGAVADLSRYSADTCGIDTPG